MNLRFSVIIPLYNKANFIAKTLNSVLNQTYTDFEVVIVNDGSTDNSLEIVQIFDDKRIKLFTTKNQGVSAARNFGIKQSNGDYIAFLDADDFWEVTFLETINNLILSYPNEQVFATALNILLTKKTYEVRYKNINLKKNEVGLLNYFKSSLGHSILHCANSVFSKKAIENIGFFDESLKTSEDTDYWIKTAFKYNVVFINLPLANHIQVDNGLSKTNKSEYKSISFKKYIKQAQNNSEAIIFLNKNIYSSIIKLKLLGDTKNTRRLKKLIKANDLNIKQNIIISLPNYLLKIIVYLYNTTSREKNYY